jgi:hypothetical protein
VYNLDMTTLGEHLLKKLGVRELDVGKLDLVKWG